MLGAVLVAVGSGDRGGRSRADRGWSRVQGRTEDPGSVRTDGQARAGEDRGRVGQSERALRDRRAAGIAVRTAEKPPPPDRQRSACPCR